MSPAEVSGETVPEAQARPLSRRRRVLCQLSRAFKRPSRTVEQRPEAGAGRTSGAAASHGNTLLPERSSPWQDFATWEAYDLMVPRVDIVGIDIEDTPDDILATLHDHPFTCFPVYRKTLDDPLGFVRVKRVFDTLTSGKALDLLVLLEKPLFVVASTRAPELMQQLYKQGVPLALVVDEYGGIDGLVTMGDFIDVLCAGPQMTSGESRRQREKAYNQPQVFDARMEIENFERELGYPLTLPTEKRDEIDTIGGLIFYLINRIPKRGDSVRVDDVLQLEVLDADPRRVKLVRAHLQRALSPETQQG
jgi:magnesium and cobalt transporter